MAHVAITMTSHDVEDVLLDYIKKQFEDVMQPARTWEIQFTWGDHHELDVVLKKRAAQTSDTTGFDFTIEKGNGDDND